MCLWVSAECVAGGAAVRVPLGATAADCVRGPLRCTSLCSSIRARSCSKEAHVLLACPQGCWCTPLLSPQQELLHEVTNGCQLCHFFALRLLFTGCEVVRSTVNRRVKGCIGTSGSNGKVTDTFTSIHDAPLHWSGRGHGKDGSHDGGLPPENVLQEIDAQELNRMFVRRYFCCNFP